MSTTKVISQESDPGFKEIEETRILASLADVEAGRVRFASPRELTDEIFG